MKEHNPEQKERPRKSKWLRRAYRLEVKRGALATAA